jgi:rhodanese-related sulfurtransferase
VRNDTESFLIEESLEETCMEPENVTMDVEPMRVTIDEVKERFARGEPLLFVDVRNPKAWKASDMKLPGAVRVSADNVDGQLDGVSPDRMIVTYCT